MATQRKVRKPGQAPNLSSEEIRDTMDPKVIAAMSEDQRAMRRGMRSKQAREARMARRRESIRQGYGDIPQKVKCGELTRRGQPCDNYRVPGLTTCAQHATPEERKEYGMAPPVPLTKKKAPEAMREVVEIAVAKILKPYFDSLGITFEGYDDETGEPVISYDPHGGIMIHGESKDGDIVMTEYENLTARVSVAEKLMDRVYGKARQTTVLEGGVQPIRVVPVKSEERAQAVADLLARSGALPPAHSGRQRRKPAKPTKQEEHAPDQS